MATSNVFTFTVDTSTIIELSMKWLGVLGSGEAPTDSEYADCLTFLNMMTKAWIVKNDESPGMPTWKRRLGYLFLASNTGTYILSTANTSNWTQQFVSGTSAGNNPPGSNVINVNVDANSNSISIGDTFGIQCDDGSVFWSNVVSTATGQITLYTPTGLIESSNGVGNFYYDFETQSQPPQIVESVVLRDNQGNDTPIDFNMPLEVFMNLPSKKAPGYLGDPLATYIESHLVSSGANSYVSIQTDVAGAQDTSKYLVISFLQETDDFVNPADEAAFPKEWSEALVFNLAMKIAPMFHVIPTDQMSFQAQASLALARNARPKISRRGFIPGARSSGDDATLLWR